MGDPSGDIDREEFWRDFLNRGIRILPDTFGSKES